MDITQILTYISIASALLPIIAAIINYKYLDYTLKTAAVFFIISGLFDLLLWIVSYLIKYRNLFLIYVGMLNNAPLLHLFNIISIVFFSSIYYRAFHGKQLKNFTVITSILTLATIIFFSIKNSIWTYPSTSNTILSVFLIPLSLLYFYQLLNRQEFVHIENQPLFWINSGVLIYFSINIFLFMLFNRLGDNYKTSYYMIQSVTNTIANLFFAIGLSCKPRKIA